MSDAALPEGTRLLILVDQFEELFRYFKKGAEDDAKAFVSLILAASRHEDIYVVMTMRSDYIGGYALFYGLPEAINQGLFLNPRQKEIAEILFRNLIEYETDGRDPRRGMTVLEIAELADADWKEVAATANAFRQKKRYCLTPAPDKPLHPEDMLDIIHESLIRQWQRLRQWAKEEREFAETYRRLEDDAFRHEHGKAPLLTSPELDIVLNRSDYQRVCSADSSFSGNAARVAAGCENGKNSFRPKTNSFRRLKYLDV